MNKLLLSGVLALALSGCAALPPLNFSVPNVGVSDTRIDAELKSITVTLARPDEKTGQLPADAQHEVPQMWQTALIEAMNRMAIFRDDAPKKLSLSVKVLKLDVPEFGASMHTDSAARYELIDRETGGIIFTQDIAATGEVPFNYAFAGVTRARESISRSVQNNITQFLQALETVDIEKPMFPNERKAK